MKLKKPIAKLGKKEQFIGKTPGCGKKNKCKTTKRKRK